MNPSRSTSGPTSRARGATSASGTSRAASPRSATTHPTSRSSTTRSSSPPTRPSTSRAPRWTSSRGTRASPPTGCSRCSSTSPGVAANAGLDYDFDALRHTKTLKAHELLHFAKEQGLQLELSERLFRAYFTEGRHVGRVDELVELAAEVGLDADAAREALESGRYAAAVQADIAQAGAYGINGVPFFVFEGKYGVSGAQPAEVFSQVLTQVAGERDGAAA